jgi:hypothetical protein
MKYLALIYGDESAWADLSEQDQQAVYAQYRDFTAFAGDKLVDGAETAASNTATTVRVRNGETAVTDGPYAETKDQLGGYFVFECASANEALALAQRIPAVEGGGTVVVRPAYVEEATA